MFYLHSFYTQWISRWIATARERILGSIGNYVTGVSECSQQRGNLKDGGDICYKYLIEIMISLNKWLIMY
ncbi:hypothetical protein [Photorhabdus laumondii]|uniref:hypothetical protein n=1 Tax=Photorhabdus laumondii TaxID=2218628 RepID=UPI000ACBBEFC|nr:hypothetical protein [Photorhabdus laumondii]NDL49512.1 hypothetical protein [Photorhabdus laumondii subsp. laumondii]